MDVRTEARRLAGVSTIFVYTGWFFVLYSVIAGILWWIDLVSASRYGFVQALGLSLSAVGGPIFLALLVAGLGHFTRLFAMYVGSQPAS